MGFYYKSCILPKNVLKMPSVAHLFIQEIFFSWEKSVYCGKKTEEIQFPEYTGAIGEAGEADAGAEIGYSLA